MTLQSIFSKVTKAAVALPIIAASLAFNAGSAEAGGLSGSFQINGFSSLIELSNQGIDFVPNPLFGLDEDAPTEVQLTAQTGDFVAFNSAFIADLIPVDLAPISPFLDLSTGAPAPFFTNDQDGESTFNVVANSGLMVSQEDPGVLGINVELDGFFEHLGETSVAQAILTFQIADPGITVEEFENRLAGGEVFDDVTFSGAAFTAVADVPEPATILGLLAVSGLAGTAIRKRKEA
ncbi:MAG: PEP-CTERM sorting domain-containing protein [Cyanobacteria bacterium P01_E01_bin.42]